METNFKNLIKKLNSNKKISKILFYLGCESMPEEAFELITGFCENDDFHVWANYPSKEDINIILSNKFLFDSTLCDVVFEGEYDEHEDLSKLWETSVVQ